VKLLQPTVLGHADVDLNCLGRGVGRTKLACRRAYSAACWRLECGFNFSKRLAAMTDLLPAVELEPAAPATASVIWLHGLGADGHDFEPLIPALRLPVHLPVRFVLPHAPSIPVTVNNRAVMPAWYDILAFGEERQCNLAQLSASAKAVHELIDREVARGIPHDRIMLAGFSQGGAVNYEAGLTYPRRLAGILALSTYFPSAGTLVFNAAQQGVPVLICHGSADQLVPVTMASNSRRSLERLGLSPEMRTYPMGHEVCNEEIADIATFIKSCLKD
jgi:phospholipase/carboxylesterase